MRGPRPWLAAVALAACTSTGSMGGVWRGASDPRGTANPLLFGDDGEPLSVELVLGEFGPDLAGLLRFYRDSTYVSSRDAAAPDAECACALVHNGRVVDSHAAFTLVGCLPGGSANAATRVRATLDESETGLKLALTVDDASSPLNGRSTSLVLNRYGLASEITAEDLACPVGPAGGNTASGL